MKKIFFLFLLASNISFSQNQMGDIQKKYYTFCHSDLTPLEKIEAYPNFPLEDLCSIKSCFRSISYEEINKVIYKRLIELAIKNFNDGILLYLIDGKKSVKCADKKNLNIDDDNGFIYISIDDFINAKEITIAKELYNNETKKLLKNKM
ncbi:hypothetical protein [Flavobacterium acetivorans]|uniref:hypothetical protein n=1 Tax=Flavobacterium acetivorans TaxID=2893883 RepID=UPI001E461346|nr:hypothetical protein [Flavobacterium sp. F-29]UFH36545.1 hypothetical protein LNP19_05750 [Flavobacterium sp. F-29]